MDTCPYYHEHGAKPDEIPCCSHKHAPIPCFPQTLQPDSFRRLRCGGQLSQCEIPPHEQLDVD